MMRQPKWMRKKLYRIAEQGTYVDEYIPGQSILNFGNKLTRDTYFRITKLLEFGKSIDEIEKLFPEVSKKQLDWIFAHFIRPK